MKEQIEEMAKVIICGCRECNCEECKHSEVGLYPDCVPLFTAESLYNAGYRKQSEVIDEFVKRLLDAFPEANRDNRCPAIYYDDYRYIIEELAEEMKGADNG